jgi:hypothetical protein
VQNRAKDSCGLSQVFENIGSGRGTRTPDPRIMIPVL